jgi:hypothetical protein
VWVEGPAGKTGGNEEKRSQCGLRWAVDSELGIGYRVWDMGNGILGMKNGDEMGNSVEVNGTTTRRAHASTWQARERGRDGDIGEEDGRDSPGVALAKVAATDGGNGDMNESGWRIV